MTSKVVTTSELANVLLDAPSEYLYVTPYGDLRASGNTVTVTSSGNYVINAGAIASLNEGINFATILISGGGCYIDNEGLILSNNTAIRASSGFVNLSNGGTIAGGVYCEGADAYIRNRGIVSDLNGVAVFVYNGNTLRLENSGVIDSASSISAYDGNDEVLNSGTITGYIQLGSGNNYFDGRLGVQHIVTAGGNSTLLGGAGAETLIGYAGDQEIRGGAGDDVIETSSGSDLLDGGDGFDLVSFAGVLDAPVRVDLQNELLNEGQAAAAMVDRFEGVIGSSYADTLSGDAASNELRGGAGSDVLDGRSGTDTLRGNSGNDLLYVDNLRDRVLEQVGGGADTVLASVTYRLAAGAEIEFLATTDAAGVGAINLTGSNTANRIDGNSGANRLFGAGGGDTLGGLGGNDTLFGQDGNDLLLGQGENDSLIGEGGFDTLDGGDGNDRLVGGEEADFLTGGAGLDILTLDTAGTVFPIWDVITDFNSADDLIWLKQAIVPGMPLGGIGGAAFTQNAGGTFSGPSQRIAYDTNTGRIYFDADGNGAGNRNLIGELSNIPSSIAANDFVVIA